MAGTEVLDPDSMDDFIDQIDNRFVLDPPGAREFCSGFDAWIDAPTGTTATADLTAWRAKLRYLKGFFAYADGEVELATALLTDAATFAIDSGDLRQQALVLRRLARCHEFAGRQTESIDCIFAALEVAEELGDRSLTAQGLAGLAALYEAQGAYELALETATRMGEIATELDDPFLQAMACNYAGLICGYLDEPQRGLVWLDKALAAIADGSFPQSAIYTRIYQFVLFHIDDRIDEAVAAAEGLLDEIAQLPAQNAAATYTHVAEIYLSAGDLDQTEAMLELATVAGKNEKLNGHLVRYFKVASDLHDARGEHKTALEMLHRHLELTKELHGRQARANVVTVERRFAGELARKTEEIHHLRTVELVSKNDQLEALNTELTDTNDQLAALNHQKDEILNVVAHDLRNPLAAAQMLSESLLIGSITKLDDDETQQLQSIRAATSEMGATIDTLLHLQQHESPTVMGRVDHIVRQSLAWATESAAGQGIALRSDISPVEFDVDSALLRRSVDDLLWIAMQATEAGDIINVCAMPTATGAQIIVSHPRVAENDRQLYIARRLVERMNGSISMDQNHGADLVSGTCVTIDLRNASAHLRLRHQVAQ